MTFAALRQTVLQANALSTSFFAEQVEFEAATGQFSTLTVKITHEQQMPRSQRTREAGQNVDELERIYVLVSRDPNYAGSLTTKPNPGEKLTRAVARDADRRPFTFAGEISYEGDQHAVYIFQRPRRYVQGRR